MPQVFTHPSFLGKLGCFQGFSVVKSVAMNIKIQMSFLNSLWDAKECNYWLIWKLNF